MNLLSLYLKYVRGIDFLIAILAVVVLIAQLWHAYWAWRGGFGRGGPHYERDRARLESVVRFASLAIDLFPLLGLLGTVAALLETFAGMSGTRISTNIISAFAPGLTSTITGLAAAMINMAVFQLLLLPAAQEHHMIGDEP